jgi:CRP-like cAMP-binding protein/rhodanese-related sulfurtransferase
MEFADLRIWLKNSVLRDLPPEALDELARTAQTRVAQPNEVIFREGDQPDAFYIIGSGRVRIFVRHKNRLEMDFTVLGPGEHFGEVALLAGDTRTASVESLEKTQLIVFSKDQFDLLMRDYPDLSRKLVREMRGLLVKAQDIIQEEAHAVFSSSRVSWLDFVLIIGVSAFLAITFNFSNPHGIPLIPERLEQVATISVSAAMEDYRNGQALIVDAMPANFYGQRHIKGAVNMPMAIFDIVYLVSFSKEDKNKKLVVYGNTISRPYDLEIADKLSLRGYKNVKVLEGGLKAWEAKGYPVEQEVSK